MYFILHVKKLISYLKPFSLYFQAFFVQYVYLTTLSEMSKFWHKTWLFGKCDMPWGDNLTKRNAKLKVHCWQRFLQLLWHFSLQETHSRLSFHLIKWFLFLFFPKCYHDDRNSVIWQLDRCSCYWMLKTEKKM